MGVQKRREQQYFIFATGKRERQFFIATWMEQACASFVVTEEERQFFSQRREYQFCCQRKFFVANASFFFNWREETIFHSLWGERISFVASASFLALASFGASYSFVVTEEERQFFILTERKCVSILALEPVLLPMANLLSLKRRDDFSFSLR